MATERPASSPTVAIARVLRRLGLVQGRRGDFRVTGFYRNGERDHTYVVLYSRHAEEVCAAHADEIEQTVEADGGWCFRVSVRYLNGSRPTVSIANAGERIREAQPAAAALEEAAQPEPAGEPEPVEDSEPVTEPTPPVEDPPDLRLQREQAAALDWSAGQADLVFAAEAGLLYRNFDGSLRRQDLPGGPGRIVRTWSSGGPSGSPPMADARQRCGDGGGPSRSRRTAPRSGSSSGPYCEAGRKRGGAARWLKRRSGGGPSGRSTARLATGCTRGRSGKIGCWKPGRR
ncbi:hypothetical protein [Streptomyces milbemycinicus]|uniref:hypothetical protein n=1 Tax=Streptomyces milbemycinicus TaxID=476552 RepID=UPI000A3CC0E1|nr:hypothetical protein [Streptomyces milbemycinicus]